ncbi:MAG TPA: HEAT repeat domain-containing protein, partial [Spirochaetota bacterium]|nr:HEAT repeat domain-containing protein [Spirochaetota bacterium]
MKIIQMILCSAAISLIAVLPINGQSQKQEKNGTSTAAPPASAQPAAKQAPESEKVKSGTKNTVEKKTAASPSPKKEETIEEKEKKTADNIEEVLKYGLQKERMLAVTKVLSIKTEAIKKRLQTVLTGSLKDEKDSDVKQKMIMVLGELKSEEAVPAIIASLGDDSEDV